MNKYEMGGNIIITTEERYEKTFKALGYKPYKEPRANKFEENNEEPKETKRTRKTLKED